MISTIQRIWRCTYVPETSWKYVVIYEKLNMTLEKSYHNNKKDSLPDLKKTRIYVTRELSNQTLMFSGQRVQRRFLKEFAKINKLPIMP